MQISRQDSVEISIAHKNTSDIEKRVIDNLSPSISTMSDSPSDFSQRPSLKSSETDEIYSEVA